MKVRPWTVIIDSMEQAPWFFKSIPGDSRDKYDTLTAVTTRRALGRCAGDYSIVGQETRCHLERKSVQDLHSTILGWKNSSDKTARRDRFEQELQFLGSCETGAVIVEGSFEDVIQKAPNWGRKSSEENAKIIFRSLLAFQNDHCAAWFFPGSRRTAEITAFRLLDRHMRKFS